MSLIGDQAIATYLKTSLVPGALKTRFIAGLVWILLRTVLQMIVFKFFWNRTISPIFGVASITAKDAFMLSAFVGLLTA